MREAWLKARRLPTPSAATCLHYRSPLAADSHFIGMCLRSSFICNRCTTVSWVTFLTQSHTHTHSHTYPQGVYLPVHLLAVEEEFFNDLFSWVSYRKTILWAAPLQNEAWKALLIAASGHCGNWCNFAEQKRYQFSRRNSLLCIMYSI